MNSHLVGNAHAAIRPVLRSLVKSVVEVLAVLLVEAASVRPQCQTHGGQGRACPSHVADHRQ